MVFLQAVQADRHRTESAGKQFPIPGCSQRQRIGDDSPREALVIHHLSAAGEVRPQQRFSTRHVDHDPMRICRRCHTVQHAGEIFHGHVHGGGGLPAVTPAVAAMQVAPECAFPEQLLQRMGRHNVILQLFINIQRDTPPQRKVPHSGYSSMPGSSITSKRAGGTPYINLMGV